METLTGKPNSTPQKQGEVVTDTKGSSEVKVQPQTEPVIDRATADEINKKFGHLGER